MSGVIPLRLVCWAMALPVAWWCTRGLQACEPPQALGIALAATGIGAIALGTMLSGLRARGAFLFGLGALSLLPIARSLIEGGVPLSHDIAAHAWRIWGTAHAFASGDLLPRWLEVTGLGLPTLQFYPPMLYWLAGLPVAAGMPTSVVWLGVGWLSGPVGAGTTWWVLRDRGFSSKVAAIGAAAFLLAPYRLLDVGYRGAIAEAFGMALMLPCWHFALCVMRGTHGERLRRPDLALVVCATLLVLVHPLSAILALWAAIPFAFFVWQPATRDLGGMLKRLLAAAIAAAGLASFYWLPVAFEQSQTQIGEVVPQNAMRYRAKALHPSQPLIRERWDGLRISWTLEQEQKRLERGDGITEVPFYLGLCLAIAVPCVLVRRAFGHTSDAEAVAFACVAVWCWAATWPSVATVNGLIPSLHALQFPWRFLAPATAAMMVPLASWLAPAIDRSMTGAVVAALVVSGLVFDAWPAFGGPSWLEWHAGTEFALHVPTIPAPTCGPDSRRKGRAERVVDWPTLVRPDAPQLASAAVPRDAGYATPHRRRPRLEGEAWVGRPTGDLSMRVVGLFVPPNSLAPQLAQVDRVQLEFFTRETARRYRRGAKRRDAVALESAGVALVFDEGRTRVQGRDREADPPIRQLSPWPRVWLRTKDGERVGLRARVSRPASSRIEIELPEGHPGGRLVFIEQAFAGWSVRVDGRSLKPRPFEGLLGVAVGPGARRVEWSYGATTAPRRAGVAISLLSLGALVWRTRRGAEA